MLTSLLSWKKNKLVFFFWCNMVITVSSMSSAEIKTWFPADAYRIMERISSGSGANRGLRIISALTVSSVDSLWNRMGNWLPVRISAFGKTEERFSNAYRVPYGILSKRQRLTLVSNRFPQELQRTSIPKIKKTYRTTCFRLISFLEIIRISTSGNQIFLYSN